MMISYLDKVDVKDDDLLTQTISLLKEAIKDWPDEMQTLEDFLLAIGNFLHSSTISPNILDNKLAEVTNGTELWHMESLESIREIMRLNNNENLETILKSLMLTLRTKKD